VKVVLDTNVLVSGIFFGGVSRALLASGDAHLLDASGWQGVKVITPRVLLTELGNAQPSDE
jgi:predicted nucleic acid-binding protein